MGMFDQAARHAIKLDPAGFFAWLFGRPEPLLVFRDWLDTRRLPFPGDPERTGDAVADFDVRNQPGGRFALILEAQTDPDPDIVERLTLYAMHLRLELRHGAGNAGKYPVGAAVLNLTGSPGTASVDIPFPGVADCGLFLRPLQRNFGGLDAAAVLVEIAAGRVARCLLPWIPLMRADDLPGIITEWKRLAELETDATRRSTFAGLALVFAELTKGLVAWQKGLENWNMRESQIILGWMREGKMEGLLEARRGDLLSVLEVRFPPEVPPDLRAAIEGTNDLEMLSRWLQAAARADSLEAFRAAMT